MKEYEFTREEYEIYCQDHLLEAESEINYNRFREMVENGELLKCINCEKWVHINWIREYGNDIVCKGCMNDGYGE